MTESQVTALAAELADASARRQFVPVPPSARFHGFDLASAYAVEAERARSRRASGRVTVGRKVGYANKALWRVLSRFRERASDRGGASTVQAAAHPGRRTGGRGIGEELVAQPRAVSRRAGVGAFSSAEHVTPRGR